MTRRRRAVAAKPKLPKTTLSILNSSDDFTSGAFGTSRIHQPSRRRRVPPAFVASSAENSVNVPGTASFATNSLREISLDELADHSLGPCPRKPIFCSTPSAGPFSKRPCLKPIPISDQSDTPPSLSVSCIGVLSTFQEDLDSPGQSVSPPRSAPPNELRSEEKSHSSFGEQEPSGDLFMKAKSNNKRRSCSEEAKSHSEDQDIKTQNSGESQSLNLLSTDDSERSGYFLSAAGELEWLIEALKERCLTVCCTVQLERLYNLTVTQLCSQTTYSSCLGCSSSGYSRQTSEHPLCVGSVQTIDLSQSLEPSFNLHLSVANDETSVFLQSVNTTKSPEHGASVTDSQSTNTSPPVDCKHSAEHSSTKEPMEQSASELHVEPTHHTDGGDEFIMGTQLPANNPVQAVFTKEDAAAVKDKCLTEKCTVQLQKWAPSQLNAQQLKGFLQQKEAGLTCNIKSANHDDNGSEIGHTHNTDDLEDLTLSGESTDRMMASNRRPINNSSPAAQTETEEKAALLATMLKEKCQTDKLIVGIKRLTVSQLKEILQLRDRNLKSPTDVSDSYSDDQIKSDHQSKSDANSSNEDTLAAKIGLKKRGSTSPKETISSDKEEGFKNSCNIPHKIKKTSLNKARKQKKRRSTSTDRPGTTRKACVSGLSVSRWKNKDSAGTHMFRSRTGQMGGNKTVDCSISELISTQHKQPRVRTTCTQTQHITAETFWLFTECLFTVLIIGLPLSDKISNVRLLLRLLTMGFQISLSGISFKIFLVKENTWHHFQKWECFVMWFSSSFL